MKQVFMRKKAMGSAHVQAEEVPVPRCGAGGVLVANRHSLISAGTESTAVRGTKRDMVVKALRDPDIRQSVVEMMASDGVIKTAERVQFEMTKWTPLGYSGAGVAVEVGRDVGGIRPGDRVAYGGQGHAEFIRAPKHLCVPVPEGVGTDEAAFVALGSIALQGIRRAEIEVGDTVVVMGLGLVGQLVGQLVRIAGARVIGTDLIPARLALAQRLGAELVLAADAELPMEVLRQTGGFGADRVIICASTSSRQVIEQAAAMARDRARVVVVGQVNLDLPHGAFYMKELDLVLSRSYGPGRYDRQYEEHGVDYPIGYVRWTEQRNMQEFLRLVAIRRVDVRALITHEFKIDEAAEGYELLEVRPAACLAVLLRYDESAAAIQRVVPLIASRSAMAAAPTAGRIAVIGCGSFARQFHLPNLRDHRRLRFQTLVASSAQSAAEMGRRYGAANSATDPQVLWSDPEVDAVMILTRDKSHASLAAAALRAGKHVFCEKPLATTIDECRLVAAAAAESDRAFITGFNRRFAPMIQTIHQVLSKCHGPKVIHYRVNAGAQPPDSWIFDEAHAEGRIVGEACHFVDLFRFLTGADIVRVAATPLGQCPAALQLQDVSAVFDFSDGSVGTLIYTAQGSPYLGKERIEIFCDGTAIAMDDFRSLTIRGRRRVNSRPRRVDKGHAAEFNHFAEVVLGESAPTVTVVDGIMASLCCIAIVESARCGEPVNVGSIDDAVSE